jgi:mannose-6-phosphate isomerase-like protein (cupin superfamily)
MSSPAAGIQQQAALSWFTEKVATADRYAVMVERTAPEGHMPPLHSRDEAETFRVLEGEVTFFIGSDIVRANRHDVVVCPAGVPRTFLVEREGTRWMVLTRVTSLDRFSDFGRAVARPRASLEWPCPSERATVASMGAANGIELLGPPGALPERG